MRNLLIGVILGLLFAPVAQASQELVIPWSSFKIRAVGPSNPIEITGTQSDAGLTELFVRAFGRDFTLSQAQLDRLKGMGINGLSLTYESGGPLTGGNALYLLFVRGRVERRVTLTETGSISISEPERP